MTASRAPKRWKDTPDAPVGVRELLSAARPPRAIDGASFERGAARLAKLSAAPATAAAAGLALSMWTKLAAAAVIGVASVTAVVAVKHVVVDNDGAGASTAAWPAASASVARVSAPPAATAVQPAAPEPAVESEPVPAPVIPSPTAAAAPIAAAGPAPIAVPAPIAAPIAIPLPIEIEPKVTERSAPPSTLAEEIPLLEQARSSLTRDPTTSLARTAQHRARYPHGVLAAERDLIELDALRRTARTSEARERAQAWLAREPSGLHAPRVRAILSSLDAP